MSYYCLILHNSKYVQSNKIINNKTLKISKVIIW